MGQHWMLTATTTMTTELVYAGTMMFWGLLSPSLSFDGGFSAPPYLCCSLFVCFGIGRTALGLTHCTGGTVYM